MQTLAEWAKTPGGEEFMNLRPDRDLVAEQASHNAERNARRHPDQLSYDGPVALPVKADAKPKTIFALAQALVEDNPQWGDARTIVKNDAGHVYISPYQERLQLIYQTSILKPAIIVDCAILNPLKGWMWTMTQAEYDSWVAQCKSGKPERKTMYGSGRSCYPDNPRNGKTWR